MSDGVLAALLVAAFLAATTLTDRLPRRVRWLPMGLLAAVFLAGSVELARYDHGHPVLLTWVGFVVAPVGAILGGASWGTRRFYGWPDFGPHPSRLALARAAILLGVLLGAGMRVDDVRVSEERAAALRERVLAWRVARDGALPARLADAAPDAPRSRMGAVAPPPFWLHRDAAGAASIAFPLSARTMRTLGLADGRWTTADRRDPPEGS